MQTEKVGAQVICLIGSKSLFSIRNAQKKEAYENHPYRNLPIQYPNGTF